MPLDAWSQALLRQRALNPVPPVAEQDLAEVRAARKRWRGQTITGTVEVGRVHDEDVPADDGAAVPVRVYEPGPDTGHPDNGTPNSVPQNLDPQSTVPRNTDPQNPVPRNADLRNPVPRGAVPRDTVPRNAGPQDPDPEGAVPRGADPQDTVPRNADLRNPVPQDTVSRDADPRNAHPRNAAGEWDTEGERDTGHGRGAVVYFHGGGWVIGDLDHSDLFCRWLCRETGLVVLNVDYRLAPEHPYPRPLLDCVAVLRALAADPDRFGVNPARVAVMGASAGGNLAAASTLALLRAGGWQPAATVLAYPVLDDACDLPSYTELGDGSYLMSRADLLWYWSQYLDTPTAAADNVAMSAPAVAAATAAAAVAVNVAVSDPAVSGPAPVAPAPVAPVAAAAVADNVVVSDSVVSDPAVGAAAPVAPAPVAPAAVGRGANDLAPVASALINPDPADLAPVDPASADLVAVGRGAGDLACPLRAPDSDLAAFPPTLVVTAEYDPVRDDGERFAERLAAAGAAVVSRRWAGTLHMFLGTPEANPASQAASRQVADFLTAHLCRPEAEMPAPRGAQPGWPTS